MDYLERLDQALESLEKEADKLTGLSKLSNTLGEVADELSSEKRQIKDAIQELSIAKVSIDNNTKELLKKSDVIEETLDKQFEAVNDSFTDNARDLEKKKELIDNKIDNSQKLVQDKIERQSRELGKKVDSSQSKVQDTVVSTKKELREKINHSQARLIECANTTKKEIKENFDAVAEKTNSAIREEHKDLNKKIEAINEDIGNLKTQIDEFKISIEKTNKIQTVIMSAAALFSLAACCLLLI